MVFQVDESLPLGRFNFEPDWTPLLGTYIVPLPFFATDRSNDPNDLVVERVLAVWDSDVAITRGSEPRAFGDGIRGPGVRAGHQY
jgi:hypothetical protein